MRSSLAFALVVSTGCGTLLSLGDGDNPPPPVDVPDGARADGETPADATTTEGGGDAAVDSAVPCIDKKTQPEHCGQCGHSCLGGTCAAGVCQPVVLASNEENPFEIAVDDSHVYWTNYVAGPKGAVRRIPKTGGAPTDFAIDNGARGLAIANGVVFWTADGVGIQGRVRREASDQVGGVTSIDSINHPTAIAAQTGAAAVKMGWTLAADNATNNGAVFLANLDLSMVSPRVPGLSAYNITKPTTIAFDPSDDTKLYYAAGVDPDDFVYRTSLQFVGGDEHVALSSSAIGAIAFLDGNVYWTHSTGIRSVNTNIFTTTNIPDVASASNTVGLVADATAKALYYVTNDEVRRIVLSNGAISVIAKGPSGGGRLAQDALALYWIAGSNPGSIMKVAKPPK
jgi:hypothetical protein